MTKKTLKRIMVFFLMSTLVFSFNASSIMAADYTQGVTLSGNNATIWFKSSVNTSWVDVHYKVNGGDQQNLRMTYNSGASRYEQVIDSAAGATLQYSFTYNNGTPAYDTPTFTFSGQSNGSISNGVYRITSKVSGKVLDVVDNSTASGAKIHQWTNYNATNQQFRVEKQSDGYYKITAMHSGLVLDVPNSSTSNSVQLQQWTSNNTNAQRWQIIDIGGGYYKVISKVSGLAMDVRSSSTEDGAVVQQYTDNGTDAQKWSFTLVSDTNNPSSGSIYSINPSTIPNPTNGGVSVKVMNGTNGAYSDSQLYWGVIGKNPTTDAWCYLDLSGNLIPISNALNDAPGHLTKNGVNYANIYHKVSETSWVNLPKIKSGRMFLSVGTPCYIKTYDNGFAGPDINNPTDPNRNIYFDFVEFTVDKDGYHGNTTRVDQFGFPVQHRLVNQAGNYDRTVGELESETRSGLFTKYQNEVPNEFKSLGTLQAPYRIVCPISGPFNTGGAHQNYFSGYSSISTRDILLGIGGASNAEVCAALNRHVYTEPANWNNVSRYYQAAPANYYAKFWHDHSIDRLAYGFCYDDVNGQASYLEVGDPKGLIIRIGW
ncbi:ricin-type beta-trefoil lectin protein [Mobilisporobacter senegalensis]|uniref:Ricin-type beta-trefoil lectin protein n=1 Tax=Mobilisporobacter senegalensis TaxID=1329262 RepID=A0A3N1XAR7_9FIRM|nr:beta-1,3-glucanase family protein [Mobilisporobacter senegalensis]ROR23879.1 ricin-type beta-trefoil lectin protein [Mobilisporobacter senegalensis]